MSSNPAITPPPASFVAGWLLRALENATSIEVITRLMQDFYNQTGTWPDPKQASSPVVGTKPTVRVVDPWESPEQDFQPPLPGIARPVAVPEGMGLLRHGKYQVTGYDYHQDSPYRREAARRLLSKIPPAKLVVDAASIEAQLEAGELEAVERMLSLHLPAGCLDLYTLMIAWSHLPIFLDASGKALGYMTLSLKRMARELGVKSDTVYKWLGLLQHYQLLDVGNLQMGKMGNLQMEKIIQLNEYELLKERIQNLSRAGNSLFSGRAIQTSSTFYRVKPELPPLPVFQPGPLESGGRGTRGGDIGDTIGRPDLNSNHQGDTLKSPQVAPTNLRDTSQLTPTSPPRVHDYELIHDDDDDKAAKNIVFEENAIKNEYPSRFEAELQLLTPEQRESFELLSSIHERIPGYTRKGMDGGQALWLATLHSKAKLIEITEAFFNRLKQGEKVDYPIGYLHKLITNGIQPTPLPGQEERTAQRQRAAQYQREPRGRRHKPAQVFTFQSSVSETGRGLEELDQTDTEPVTTTLPDEADKLPLVNLELKRRLVQIDRKADWLSRLLVDGTTVSVRFVGQIPDFNQNQWLSVVQRMYPQVTEIVVL